MNDFLIIALMAQLRHRFVFRPLFIYFIARETISGFAPLHRSIYCPRHQQTIKNLYDGQLLASLFFHVQISIFRHGKKS